MSVTFDPGGYPVQLSAQSALIATSRYDPASGFQGLPNVQCIQVTTREGEPGTARFKYLLSDLPGNRFPDSFADLIPIDAVPTAYLVKADDRLVVAAYSPDTGEAVLLFDGYAQSPESAVSDSGQSATFTAAGVAVRCWDTPLMGAVYRDGDDPVNGQAVQTSLPIRFNPNDAALPTPNATPLGADLARPDGLAGNYPLFVTPALTKETSADDQESQDAEDQAEIAGLPDDSPAQDAAVAGDTRRLWTVGMAARYIIHTGLTNQSLVTLGSQFTDQVIDPVLQAIAPPPAANGAMAPKSLVLSDIVVRDLDVSNLPWPEALRRLLWPHGYRFRFDLSSDSRGNPTTLLRVYRTDMNYSAPAKALQLQQPGQPLDPAASNVASLKVVRDTSEAFNVVAIETDPVLYELSVILAPGFQVNPNDAAAAILPSFKKSAIAGKPAAQRNAYRLWIFDEIGDGHWSFKKSAFVTTPGDPDNDLTQVFGGNGFGKRAYVRRYRPGRNEAISTIDGHPDGIPYRSRLDFSRDYTGDVACVWDKTGTWQSIPGGWVLLRDRLGIRVTTEDPNQWDVGDYKQTTTGNNTPAQNGGKFLNGVEAIANPVAAGASNFKSKGLFFLRLTTVIEGDQGLIAGAGRRPASPRQFAITSRIDCRDHFRKLVVDASSAYAGGLASVPRDDTSRAVAHARAVRSANEMGKFAGQATIPRISTAYEVGDRVSGIVGTVASFRTSGAAQTGEAPTYPVVVGVTWDLDGRQATVLDFADDRAQPPRA